MGLRPISFLLLGGVIYLFSACAPQFGKYVSKYDKFYTKGKYEKAEKFNDKLKKKSIKKLGPQNKYIPFVLVNDAKLSLQNGRLLKTENNLSEAIKVSKEINGDTSDAHAQLLLESIDIFIELGNYHLAKTSLDNYNQLFGNKISEDEKAKLTLIQLNILKEQGDYNEAIRLAKDRIEFYMDHINEDVKKDKREKRYNAFATLINIIGEVYIKRGDYHRADSTLKSNTAWIEDHLNKRADPYAVHQLILAKSQDRQGNHKEARNYYKDAVGYAEKGRDDYDKFVLDIQGELIQAYARHDKRGRYNSELSRYKDEVKENYSKKNVFALKANLYQLGVTVNKNPYDDDVSKALQIINNQSILPRYHPIKLKAYDYIHKVAIINKNHKGALEAIEYKINATKHLYGKEAPVYHMALLDLANYNITYTNKIQQADTIFEKSWYQSLAKQIHYSHDKYIEIQNNLAAFYELVDDYERASEALSNAFKATAKTYSRGDVKYANEVVKLADLQTRIGEFGKAEQYLDLVLEQLHDNRKDNKQSMTYYITALETKARLYAKKGMFEEAEDLFHDTRKMLQKEEIKDFDRTVGLEEMAKIYLRIGLYAEAEDLLKKAISDKEKKLGTDNKSLISPLVVLGRLNLIKGDYTDAENLAKRANDIATNVYGSNSSKTISSLVLNADIDNTLGDYEKAKEILGEAIGIHLEVFGEAHIQLAKLFTKLAMVKLNDEGEIDDIKSLFDRSEKILLKELDESSPLYADLLTNKAYVHIANKEYGEAFQTLLTAEKIWVDKLGKRNNINVAEIRVFLGDIYYMLKNFAEAKDNYEDAERLYKKFFSKNHPEYVNVLSKISKVAYMEGDLREARKTIDEVLANYNNFIKYYFPALSEREKARFWNTIKDDYEYFNTLVLKSIDDPDDKLVGKMYNNALNTKALLLNSSIKMRKNILNSGDEELIGMYNDWLKGKELLTNVLSMSLEQKVKYNINEDSLVQEVEQLEKELSKRSELFSQNAEKSLVNWEEVKSALEENEVAIEMVRFRHFDHVFTDSVVYAALTLRNERNRDRPEIIVMDEGENLEGKYFKYYKNMIKYRMKDNISYEKYWKPIEDKIGPIATVYLSPDGVYNQINLEAIYLGDDKYVLDNSNIVLVSNTKDLHLQDQRKQQDSENRALMFGDPEFYVSAKPNYKAGNNIIYNLPGTKKEVVSLHELLETNGWQTDYYLEAEASEQEVKALDNPKVFHIATHGFYTPKFEVNSEIDIQLSEAEAAKNPLLRSGLMLKGAGDVLTKTRYNYNIESGILTAYEAMNLNLDYTDLVVLSACETGVGDVTAGEGVYGLQRAFLVAGAKNLIMSLFNVSDEATNELMVTFYRKWLQTGKMRKSFIEAKKEIRTKYKDPIYWGSFIMFGLE